MYSRIAILCLVLMSYGVNAARINLTEAIDVVRSQGLQIVYSNENFDANNLIVDIELNNLNKNTLKDYLITIDFELLQLKKNLYVIKSLKTNKVEVDKGLIVFSIYDQEHQTRIEHAQVKLKELSDINTGIEGSFYTIGDLEAKQYNIEIEAEGYIKLELTLDLSKDNIFVKDLFMDLLPLSLDNILVTTSQYDFQVEKGNNSIVLYSEELKATPHIGNDPVRAMAKLPGLTGNGISARHYVRGGKLDESGVVLNGLSLKDPYHFKDFFGIFSIIDLSYTDDVSLYTGVFPAKFGDHISSVMSINSIKPQTPLVVDASLGVFNSHLTIGGQLTSDSNYIASIRSGGDFFHSNLLEVNAGDPKYDDGFFSLTHTLNDRTEVQVNLLYSRDKISIDISSEDEFANAQYQDRNIWVSMKNKVSENTIINSQIYYQTSLTDRRGNLNDEEITGTLIESTKGANYGLSIGFDYQINSDLVISVGSQWSNLQSDSVFELNKQSNDFITGLLNQDTNIHRNHHFENTGHQFSFYSNLRYQINSFLYADFGLRYDQQSWIDKKQISPRVNFSYFYGDDTTFRLGIGSHQQAQEIDDLLFEDETLIYFKPEMADIIVFEATRELNKNTNIRAEVYYKDYKNVRPYYENLFIGLHLHPELFSDRVRIAPDSAVARGIDVTLSKSYDSFNWSVGYSFASSKDVVDGVTQHRSWDQKNGIKLNFDWRYKNWDLSSLLIYHSGWPRTIIRDNDSELSVGGRNDNRNEDLLNLDIRAVYNFKIKNTDSSFWMQVSNVLDRDNQCCVEYTYEQDESGQQVLSNELIRWLPLIPTLGFSIYFD